MDVEKEEEKRRSAVVPPRSQEQCKCKGCWGIQIKVYCFLYTVVMIASVWFVCERWMTGAPTSTAAVCVSKSGGFREIDSCTNCDGVGRVLCRLPPHQRNEGVKLDRSTNETKSECKAEQGGGTDSKAALALTHRKPVVSFS